MSNCIEFVYLICFLLTFSVVLTQTLGIIEAMHNQLESERSMDGYRFSFLTGVLIAVLGEPAVAGLIFCTGLLVESPLMGFIRTWIETSKKSTRRS